VSGSGSDGLCQVKRVGSGKFDQKIVGSRVRFRLGRVSDQILSGFLGFGSF
jgi:hypothetical protein